MTEPFSWCCAQTHEYCEALAARSLAERTAGAVFLPRIYEEKIVRRKPVRRPQPLFPGYAFVQLDLSGGSWKRASYARGVARLLGPEDAPPSRIRDSVIEELMARCDGEGFYIEGDAPALVGSVRPKDPVTVVEGPFASFPGLCYMARGERVGVLLTVFGREMKLQLRREQVALAA